MSVELIERVRPRGERHWLPFGPGEPDSGFNGRWWNRAAFEGHMYFSAVLDGVEVGRIDLDPDVHTGEYVGVPPLAEPLEIQFVEVRLGRRGEGIGARLIEALTRRFGSRRLVAFSMEADGFYESLGWARHLNRDSDIAHLASPLYVQPGAAD